MTIFSELEFLSIWAACLACCHSFQFLRLRSKFAIACFMFELKDIVWQYPKLHLAAGNKVVEWLWHKSKSRGPIGVCKCTETHTKQAYNDIYIYIYNVFVIYIYDKIIKIGRRWWILSPTHGHAFSKPKCGPCDARCVPWENWTLEALMPNFHRL